AQLKYSGDPSEAWSVARLTNSSARRGNNSVLRKLADDFHDARARMQPTATLSLRIVSNQPVADDVTRPFQALGRGDAVNDPIDRQNMQKITTATGLEGQDLFAFASRQLDFSKCGGESRFAHREKVIFKVAELVDDIVALDVSNLRQNVRNLMLPERH